MIIIPCAGYGNRINMPYDKSKEMLIDPVTNQPLIQWTLDRASEVGQKALVITRHKKTDLIEYCKQQSNVEVLILEEDTFDWAETVLKSESYWEDYNILLLPDTRFRNVEILKTDICTSLFFGTHKVRDSYNWGILANGNICEKPKGMGRGYAWGFIGFKKTIGKEFFTAMLNKNVWYEMNNYYSNTLYDFVDLTRTGKILNYD